MSAISRIALRALCAPLLAAGTLTGCSDSDWLSLQSDSGFIKSAAGPRIFWRTLGSGPDTVVVLHGGVGLHHRYLLGALAPLVPHRTLIFYDMRGRGESDAVLDSTLFALDADVADLDAVRRHFGLERVKLIGHHWGGAVAAIFASRNPGVVDRMMLISPFPVHYSLMYAFTLMPGDTARYSHALSLAGHRSDPDSVSRRCADTWTLFFAPWRTDVRTPYDKLGATICDAPADRLARADFIRNETQRSIGMWAWREQLRGVNTPALIVEGNGDSLVVQAATRWAQHLANARVLLLPRPYLFPWAAAPAHFRRTASVFLDGSFPPGAVKPQPFLTSGQ
jgi:proline iminopeptidase